MKQPMPPNHSKPHHRGSAYVLFLITAMIVTLIGMSAVLAIRIQRRIAQTTQGIIQARHHAQSAIELGFAMINQDPDWRTNLGTGPWITDQSMGSGTISLDATLLDQGDADPDNDSVILIGTGVQDQAIHKTQVTANAKDGGMIIEYGSWMRNAN